MEVGNAEYVVRGEFAWINPRNSKANGIFLLVCSGVESVSDLEIRGYAEAVVRIGTV